MPLGNVGRGLERHAWQLGGDHLRRLVRASHGARVDRVEPCYGGTKHAMSQSTNVTPCFDIDRTHRNLQDYGDAETTYSHKLPDGDTFGSMTEIQCRNSDETISSRSSCEAKMKSKEFGTKSFLS